MTTTYPTHIDGYSNIRVVRDGIDQVVARDHNDNRGAIIAIEQSLGISPQGPFGTVAARLDFLQGEAVTAGGDLSGMLPDPTVVGLQGREISSNVPVDGYALVWSDGYNQWINGPADPGGPALGDLSGTYPNPIVSGIYGRNVSSTTPVDGYALTWNIGLDQWESNKPVPGGSAGGDLYGIYPRPSVVKIQGYNISSTTPIDGYALIWNSGANEWQSSEVNGPPTGVAGGDLSSTYPNPTVSKIQNRDISTALPHDGYVLVWNSSASQWAPQIQDGYRLQNRRVSSSPPNDGYSLVWSASANEWVDILVNGGVSGPASGDLSGIYPSPTVSKIQGNDISSSVPTDGYALTWNIGLSEWESNKPVPGGPAGGDLSGLYPRPTVAKIQGRNIASTAPTDGYGLVWNSSLSQWEPQASGSVGGGLSQAQVLARML